MAVNSYVPDMPQGQQPVNSTQPLFFDNFGDISTLFGVNHVGFNVTNSGKHTIVNYVDQAGVIQQTGANEMVLFAQSVAHDPNSMELFGVYPNNQGLFQLTGSTSNGSSGGGTIATYAPYGGGTYGTTSSQGWASGYYQYLSNGVLFMTWAPITVTGAAYNPTTPVPCLIPNKTGGAPGFTQTPFCVLMSVGYGQAIGGLSGNLFAAIPTSATNINLYTNGSGTAGIIIGSPYFIAIGI